MEAVGIGILCAVLVWWRVRGPVMRLGDGGKQSVEVEHLVEAEDEEDAKIAWRETVVEAEEGWVGLPASDEWIHAEVEDP